MTKRKRRLDTFPWRLLNVGSQMQTAEKLDSPSTSSKVRSWREQIRVSSRNPDTILNYLGYPNRQCRSRQIAGGNETKRLRRNPWSKTQTRCTLPLVLHWRHCSLRGPTKQQPQAVRRRTHEPKFFRANPRIVVAYTQCAGTQDSLVVKSTNTFIFNL